MLNFYNFSICYFNFRKKIIKPGKRLTLSSSTSVTSEASLYTALGTDDEFHDMSSENEESQHSNIDGGLTSEHFSDHYTGPSLLDDDIFDKVDELFEGSDEDKLKAYEILVNLNEEVNSFVLFTFLFLVYIY